MNAFKLIALALLVTVNLACSKSETDNMATPATTGTLIARIDGQSFTTTKAVSTYTKTTKDVTVTGGNSLHTTGEEAEHFNAHRI